MLELTDTSDRVDQITIETEENENDDDQQKSI